MADSGKKRKRNADGSVKPSKKAAISEPASVANVKVSLVEDSGEWAPIVASAPGLSVSSSLTLQPYKRGRKNAPQKPGHSGAISTEELLLQSSAHPKIDYLGREEESGGTDSLLKHYVGVYDPVTGELKVMEARKMTLRATVRSQQAAPEAMIENGMAKDMRDLRNDLGQTFGTKKAKKAIASLSENAIDPNRTYNNRTDVPAKKLNAATSATLASMAEVTSKMASREQLQASADAAKPKPQPNLAAQSVTEVYTLDSLIGNDILTQVPVKDWQEAAKDRREVITKSRFVSRRLQNIASDSKNVPRLRALRYLLALIQFKASIAGWAGKFAKLPRAEELSKAVPGIPKAVLESIRRKFTEGPGNVNSFQRDFLITHICALALVVDNFSTDFYDLMEDLTLEAKQMNSYFLEIGAKTGAANANEMKRLNLDKAAGSQKRFARLTLPLEFPQVRVMKAKKR